MLSSYISKILLILPLCLALSACGPDWEAVKTTDIVPYGNSRTAGSGVMYVRAHLMPEKELNLNGQSQSVQETQEILDNLPEDRGDVIFKKHQNSKK